ncbi:hypothetical protein [Methanoculleus sediminis]|uniref:hypothetical protein n=1 Tax=Methanoculleus sediminis TaxID=1550566 RepID=UPI000B239503|nr:hypothetical protein [Methanoculleus sediminis]
MGFESLSNRYTFKFNDFPERWLPLISLYDPDLPLFPIYYFHVLSPTVTGRPGETDRVFGYVEKINIFADNRVDVTVVLNKNLQNNRNTEYIEIVESEIRERFGLNNPVKREDLQGVFAGKLPAQRTLTETTSANLPEDVLNYLWDVTVSNSYGGQLPFGRLWDPVFGLVRWVASWNSPSGRKSELIQTHYFLSRFGVRINTGDGYPKIDFFLLPTYEELRDSSNPLTWFPEFSKLVNVTKAIHDNYCEDIDVREMKFSKFNAPFKKASAKKGENGWTAEKLKTILMGNVIPTGDQKAAIECFNAFDKGPQRPLILLMMLGDLRNDRWNPEELDSDMCGRIYQMSKSQEITMQSPKVIALYSQQCFGNADTFPIDTWMDTLLRWPLAVWPKKGSKHQYITFFKTTRNLGKVERLLWVVCQAKKVHSSVCGDILWCIKYGSQDADQNALNGDQETEGNNTSKKKPRGANPLACKICKQDLRDICPAYNGIKDRKIGFNVPQQNGIDFVITTSEGNNSAINQKITRCIGFSVHENIVDEYSLDDNPSSFSYGYPHTGRHSGEKITVEEFINLY